jgi:two-component system, NtrC family, response regulator AtoC
MDSVLIIDDKIKICQSLSRNFDQRGYHPFYATSGLCAIKIAKKERIDAVLLDIMLGEENGIDVLTKLLNLNKELPVIMITGHASIDTAVQSIKLGAFDYVQKPLDFEKLLIIVDNAIRLSNLREENRHLRDRLDELSPHIVTQNKVLIDLCEKAEKLAVTDFPILILGENGTGKEIIADLIHAHSHRNSSKMLKINCAAFAETLLENELFGHEKGAYTGADFEFKGIFELAHKSSLFLDEIGDMPLSIQAKILRALQNREIRRLGSDKTIMVDVRFIASTNKNIMELLSAGKFREDLYYRLNTAVITIPPLRNRKEDVPLLVEHFLMEYARTNSTQLKKVKEAAFEKLLYYDWPGNIRELKNTINYAAAISPANSITIEDLPPNIVHISPPSKHENIREEMEKRLILNMLQKTSYNKKKSAKLLSMSRKTLYNKLKKYGISK